MVKIPKGESFLPNYTVRELTDLYYKEKDSKAKVRLLAAILRKEGKKLVIVIDQGPYHASYEMQKFYEKNKEHLHVVHFPAYSPELDPIEQS